MMFEVVIDTFVTIDFKVTSHTIYQLHLGAVITDKKPFAVHMHAYNIYICSILHYVFVNCILFNAGHC